jgi:glycosyltransferase involved in cell wall biosynthesis
MPTEKIPLVSVVIPMYNAARFVLQTLKSLLYQTMTDFEVVVIDDCSTDNSIEIVKNFADRFFNRGINISLTKFPENSGAPGLVRNVGIQLARGKYISFLDSDDLYTTTALEELSTLAEKYKADIVHNDEFFCFDNETASAVDTKTLMDVSSYPGISRLSYSVYELKQITYEPIDLEEKILLWLSRGFNWSTCASFCRRDFLIANQISFSNMPNNEDMVFSFRSLCSTKNFLRVPNCTYIYRQRQDSVSKETFINAEDHFHKWLRVMKNGFDEFEKIMCKISFFDEHPDYRYAVKGFFFNEVSKQFMGYYLNNLPFVLNPLVKKEFHSDDADFYSYLFDTVYIYRLQIMQLQEELSKFQKQ